MIIKERHQTIYHRDSWYHRDSCYHRDS